MAIAFSQTATGTGTVTTTVNVTITVNAGDTVVVSISNNLNDFVSTVTDDGGSTYINKGFAAGGGFHIQELWITGASLANAATTVTVKYSGNETFQVSVATYTGVQQIGATTTNVSSGSTTPTITQSTVDANNFLVAAMGTRNTSASTWSANIGNLEGNLASGAATVPGVAIVDNTRATPGSLTCRATISSSEAWDVRAIELRSVGPTVPNQLMMVGCGV